MLSTILVIIKLSADNIENLKVIIKLSVENIENSKRSDLILVSCIRIIPPQGIQDISQTLSKSRSKLFQL